MNIDVYFSYFRNCNEDQDLFQALVSKVNLQFKDEAEKQNDTPLPKEFFYPKNQAMFEKLAKNYTQAQISLDKIWKKLGKFTGINKYDIDDVIFEEMSLEVSSLTESCVEIEPCWNNVEKIKRSIFALYSFMDPFTPGLYLAYQRLALGSKYKLDLLAVDFNKYLMDITSVISDGKHTNISISDLSGFGSMVNSFESDASCFNYFGDQPDLYWSCNKLMETWKNYMTDSGNQEFPTKVHDSSVMFDFTNQIKKDMPTFLATYAASIQTISGHSTNTALWRDVAKRIFKETRKEEDVIKQGYYDKLIMSCTFKVPLMSKRPDIIRGCMDFYHSLTSNGLCQSFNSIEPSRLWKDADIIQSFNQVFGRFQDKNRRFRGIGHSEGKFLHT